MIRPLLLVEEVLPALEPAAPARFRAILGQRMLPVGKREELLRDFLGFLPNEVAEHLQARKLLLCLEPSALEDGFVSIRLYGSRNALEDLNMEERGQMVARCWRLFSKARDAKHIGRAVPFATEFEPLFRFRAEVGPDFPSEYFSEISTGPFMLQRRAPSLVHVMTQQDLVLARLAM